jgi:anti-sigma B factor antagonist
MTIKRQNGTLTVSDLRELNAANARLFSKEICAALLPELRQVEIDLSQVGFVDGNGIGALASLYTAARRQCRQETLSLRLLRPQPPVQQLLELTRMHHIFEIVPQNGETTNGHSLRAEQLNGAGQTK